MKTIGRYEVVSLIGSGAMGAVYRGRDPQLDVPVAIKVIHEHLAVDPATLERFKNEAVIQARLRHPNIVVVHDFLLDRGHAAIVMEYVDGRSLDDVLSQETGPMPQTRCLEIMRQILGAVGHAHQLGIVHRDLKPSNIMVQWYGPQVHVKITDFGIAKILGNQKSLTGAQAKMGTLLYMSPEQIRSPREVDHRADIYSLGCTLYEMAAGAPPFDSDSEYELMTRILTQEPLPPRDRYPHVEDRLAAVITRSMSKDPAGRYQSCQEFLTALLAAASGEGLADVGRTPTGEPVPHAPSSVDEPAVVGPTTPVPTGRRTRSPVVGFGLAAVILLGGILGAVALSRKNAGVRPTSSLTQNTTALPNRPPVRSETTSQDASGQPPSEDQLPFFMVRPVTDSDLAGRSKWALDVMRNEIYARHGRRFARRDLQEYFSAQPWYVPRYAPEGFPSILLTDVQTKNIDFIRRYQDRHNPAR